MPRRTIGPEHCGGDAQPNAGITHVSVAPPPDGARLFVTAAANATAEARRTLTLSCDGEVVDAREITIPAGGSESLVFALPAGEPGSQLRCRVALDPPDPLRLDDDAFVGIARRRPPRVLHLGEPEPFVGRMPQVFPGLELVEVPPGRSTLATEPQDEPFDPAVVTAALPDGAWPPAARVLCLGVVPEGLGLDARSTLQSPPLLDWDRKSPHLRDAGFENLLVLKALRFEAPEAARALIRVAGGAQLLEFTSPDRTVLIWASGPLDSNDLLLPAFPLLVRNPLGDSIGGVEPEIHRAHGPLQIPAGLLRLIGRVTLSVQNPAGKSHDASLFAEEPFFCPGRLATGFYEARARANDGGEA